jgi:hypothetical protein
VDLRWGVNEESQLNQKTLDICLNEIARCQRISPKPNFLILLGNKYGWQPIPTKIPQAEMEDISTVLSPAARQLLDTWYKLDTNALPAEYVLQPRGEEYKEYRDWEKVETEIRTMLRVAVLKLKFTSQQSVKYFASATHQEIIHGALSPQNSKNNPAEHVLALIRETDGLPNDKTADGYIDLINERVDAYSGGQLSKLKDELSAKLGDHYVTYPAQWVEKKSAIEDTAKFEETVYNFLEKIIQQQIDELISPDEIDHEVKLHTEFKDKLTEYFCGRKTTLETIKNYCGDTERNVLSLIGDSGSGKSSVMAKAILDLQNCNANALTVFRFIGITSNSSNIISLLRNICWQIAREFNVTLESLAGEGKEKALYEINGMTEVYRKCLALGTAEKPVIVFLDALDQLSDTDNAKALYWIPRELPGNAKVIVSSITEEEGKLGSTSVEHLPLLPIEEAEKILSRWLGSINRKLTPEQQTEVITKFSINKLPIYLKIAFEQAKNWHSYDGKISIHEDVKGIINDFFKQLEIEHDRDFVEHVICYMLCGRYQGLAENEILEILVFDERYWNDSFLIKKTHKDHRAELAGVTKIPIVVWSLLYLDLEPFLTERDADGVPIITFFHRQFNEVLRERYKLDEDKPEADIGTA